MKIWQLISLVCILGWQDRLGAEVPAVILTGLVRLPGEESVVLEVRGTRLAPLGYILRAGEREGWLEVLAIHAEQGSADLSMQIGPQITNLPPTFTNARFSPDGRILVSTIRFQDATNRLDKAEMGLVFKDANWRDALDYYSRVANRTLLYSGSLPGFNLTLKAVVRDRQEAAATLEEALLAKGISSVSDGNKFLALVRTSEAYKFKPRSSELTNITPVQGAGLAEVLPAGVISIQGVEARDVALIYAELKGRKFDRTGMAPCPVINLKAITPMSRDEALYAMDTIFAFDGVKMEPVGDDSMRLVQIAQ
jgi:hypothetical protein